MCNFKIWYKMNVILRELSPTNSMRVRSMLQVPSTWVIWEGSRPAFGRCPS